MDKALFDKGQSERLRIAVVAPVEERLSRRSLPRRSLRAASIRQSGLTEGWCAFDAFDSSRKSVREVPMERLFVMAGALFALVGVGLGAFGAHALEVQVDAKALGTFEVGVRYQMYHALALLALAWVHERWPGRLVRAAGWLFIAGTLIFSGSLYVLVLLGIGWLGAITPVGGAALLAGWACLLAGAWRGR